MISTITIHVLEMRKQAQKVSDLSKFIQLISGEMGFKVKLNHKVKLDLWAYISGGNNWLELSTSYTLESGYAGSSFIPDFCSLL